MLKKYVLIAAVSLFVCGCSVYHIDSRDTTLDFYPPKASPQDVVYLEQIDKPYDVIGTVTVTTERTRSLAEIIVKMKYEAAVLGGDAITDIQTDVTGSWKKTNFPKFLENAYIRSNYSAKVIVFK